MKNYLIAIVCIICCSSCSDETTISESPVIKSESKNRNVDVRNTDFGSLFYNYYYVGNLLNLQLPETGSFAYVDELFLSMYESHSKSSFYQNLEENNILPCWSCAVTHDIGKINYIIPFYDIRGDEIDAVLVVQEENGTQTKYYLEKTLVTFLHHNYPNGYSAYWSYIFDNCQLKNDLNKVASNRSCSDIIPCGSFCPNGHVLPYCCHPWEICGSGDGGAGGPNPISDPFSDLSDWGGNGLGYVIGSEPGEGPTELLLWLDECSVHNGSLGEDDGETLVESGLPESGNIPLQDPLDMYTRQLENIISNHNLPFNDAEELIDQVGPTCAVSNPAEVLHCLKCHFITPLGLSGEDNYFLQEHFDIVVQCMGDPNPDCLTNNIALRKLEIAYPELNFSKAEKDYMVENPESIEQIKDFILEEGLSDFSLATSEMIISLGENDLLDLTYTQLVQYEAQLENIINTKLQAHNLDSRLAISATTWYAMFSNEWNNGDSGFTKYFEKRLKAVRLALKEAYNQVFKPILDAHVDALSSAANELGIPDTSEEWRALMAVFGPMLLELGVDIGTDFIPVVGEVKAFTKSGLAFGAGDYSEALLEFIGGVAGTIPVGDLIKGAGKVVQAGGTIFLAFKVIKAMSKFNSKIFNKIIEFAQLGWKTTWDNGLKKLVFKQGDEIAGEIGEKGVPTISKAIFRSVIDPSTLKSLNPKTLTNTSSGNSISKSFINENGSKFNVLEPNLKSQFDDIVANGDQFGTKTEDLIKDVIEDGGQSGWTHNPNGTYGSNNGFDGVFINGDEVIINESKQWTGTNSVHLSGSTQTNEAQMTDLWVDKVITELLGTNNTNKINLANKIKAAKDTGKLTKIVTVVDRTTAGNSDNLLGGIAILKVD